MFGVKFFQHLLSRYNPWTGKALNIICIDIRIFLSALSSLSRYRYRKLICVLILS